MYNRSNIKMEKIKHAAKLLKEKIPGFLLCLNNDILGSVMSKYSKTQYFV
jgi:hypothetical protein